MFSKPRRGPSKPTDPVLIFTQLCVRRGEPVRSGTSASVSVTGRPLAMSEGNDFFGVRCSSLGASGSAVERLMSGEEAGVGPRDRHVGLGNVQNALRASDGTVLL